MNEEMLKVVLSVIGGEYRSTQTVCGMFNVAYLYFDHLVQIYFLSVKLILIYN